MEASARSNLKPVSLELGGKSPLIIFDDADVDLAVDLSISANFFNKVNTILIRDGIAIGVRVAEISHRCCREKLASRRAVSTCKRVSTIDS